MNETTVTVTGNVTNEPQLRATASGVRVVNFRVASNERVFDRGLGDWRDLPPNYFSVSMWRTAAENIAASLQKGQPVIVTGKLRQGSYEDKDGVRHATAEIHASAVGHNLARGVTSFRKAVGNDRPETFAVSRGDLAAIGDDRGFGDLREPDDEGDADFDGAGVGGGELIDGATTAA